MPEKNCGWWCYNIEPELKKIENLPILAHCSKTFIQPKHCESRLYLCKDLQSIYGGIFFSRYTSQKIWPEERLSRYGISHVIHISHIVNCDNTSHIQSINGIHKYEQINLNVSHISSSLFNALLKVSIFIYNAFKCQLIQPTILILDSMGHDACFMFVAAYIMSAHNHTFAHVYRLLRSMHAQLEIHPCIANLLHEYAIKRNHYLEFKRDDTDCACTFHSTIMIKNRDLDLEEDDHEPAQKKIRTF